MKKRISVLIALAMLFSAVTLAFLTGAGTAEAAEAYPVFEQVNTIEGTVTATLLNMRYGPSTQHQIIGKLRQNETVMVFGRIGDWYAVYNPANGCVGAVHSDYIRLKSEEVNEAADTDAEPTVSVAPTDVTEEEEMLLNLINKARADAGVTPLKLDRDIMKSARMKAQEMVDKNYFSHQSPTYGSPFDMMRANGIAFKTAGENIAGNKTVEDAFKAWMNSEEHKKNLLNSKFNYAGIGIAESKTYGKILVVQTVGR
jgi:uncharacterized YkwD family protein